MAFILFTSHIRILCVIIFKVVTLVSPIQDWTPMHLLAQQAPEDAATAGKWATIVVLTLVFIALNYKRWTRPSGGERLKINPGVIITAVAVGMGAFGMFLDVLNWTWTADFSKWVTNDLLHLNATVAPWVWLAASIGMRSAQIWQGEKGPVRKLL